MNTFVYVTHLDFGLPVQVKFDEVPMLLIERGWDPRDVLYTDLHPSFEDIMGARADREFLYYFGLNG